MQTFLPYPSFVKSAAVLDMKRLGKQRVEAKQVLQSLLDVDKWGMRGNTGQNFANHPIYSMWEPYPEALMTYTYYICKEWRSRGYKDGVMTWLFGVAGRFDLKLIPYPRLIEMEEKKPWWLGKAKLHVFHRANLMAKDRSWYLKQPEQLGFKPWVIPDSLKTGFGYQWPATEPDTWRAIRRAEQ